MPIEYSGLKKYFYLSSAIILSASWGRVSSAGEEANAFIERQMLPDEYESVGGHSLGLGNSAMAATSGIAALRLNPAMLASEPAYIVSGDYHWPRVGREFYKAGIVDSKTSPTAAALSYTGFTRDYFSATETELNGNESPLVRRASLGFAQNLKAMAIGISGHYVEGLSFKKMDGSLTKSWTLGFGVGSQITPLLKAGVSIENVANSKVRELAPRVLRAGLSMNLYENLIVANLDYHHRERIAAFEDEIVIVDGLALSRSQVDGAEPRKLQAEQMVVASGYAKVYDLIRLMAAWGTSVDSERQSLSGGVSVVNQNISLSYGASRPHMKSEKTHQAVSLSFGVSL